MKKRWITIIAISALIVSLSSCTTANKSARRSYVAPAQRQHTTTVTPIPGNRTAPRTQPNPAPSAEVTPSYRGNRGFNNGGRTTNDVRRDGYRSGLDTQGNTRSGYRSGLDGQSGYNNDTFHDGDMTSGSAAPRRTAPGRSAAPRFRPRTPVAPGVTPSTRSTFPQNGVIPRASRIPSTRIPLR